MRQRGLHGTLEGQTVHGARAHGPIHHAQIPVGGQCVVGASWGSRRAWHVAKCVLKIEVSTFQCVLKIEYVFSTFQWDLKIDRVTFWVGENTC